MLATRPHACLGISPFNSAFSPTHLVRLARWALETFVSVHFFVPDAPSASTLQALGYPPERAAHKARRQGQYVRNKLWRALTILDVPEPGALILDWTTLTANPVFTRLHDAVWDAYDSDATFRHACLEASAWVLDNRLPPGTVASPEQQRLATCYLLAELPLFTDTAAIVGADASTFATTRHRCSWNVSTGAPTAGSRPAARGLPASNRSVEAPWLAQEPPSGRVDTDML